MAKDEAQTGLWLVAASKGGDSEPPPNRIDRFRLPGWSELAERDYQARRFRKSHPTKLQELEAYVAAHWVDGRPTQEAIAESRGQTSRWLSKIAKPGGGWEALLARVEITRNQH